MLHQYPQLSLHRSSRLSPAPLTFLEMERKVDLDAVELRQASLREAPEALNPVDVDAISGELVLGVIDPEVLVVANVDQSVVPTPTIRVDDGVERYLSPNDRLERVTGAVGDDLGIDPTITLEDPKHRLLQGPTTALELPVVAFDSTGSEVALVELNLTNELTQLRKLLVVDEASEAAEPEIDRVTVHPGQLRRFRGLNVNAEVLYQLFQFVGRDPNHMSSLISAGLLV